MKPSQPKKKRGSQKSSKKVRDKVNDNVRDNVKVIWEAGIGK